MIEAKLHGDVLQLKMSRYPDFLTGTWVCAYLVDGLLVDTGPAHTAVELTGFLKDKGLHMAVNTHFHEDHISANKLLQDAYLIPIYAHPLAIDKIYRPATLYPYQEDVWGYPVPSSVEPLGEYIETEKYRFDVVPTPGHDLDHVCLFEKTNGWLFTGDLYVTTNPVVCRPNDNMWQVLEDVKKIRALNPQMMFPAPTHVVNKPLEKLDKLIAYLGDLGARIDGLYEKGMSADEIRKEVFGDEGIICEATQQQFSSLNMVKSFLRKYNGRHTSA
jgi:ribonuclease/clavin/mitogillin